MKQSVLSITHRLPCRPLYPHTTFNQNRTFYTFLGAWKDSSTLYIPCTNITPAVQGVILAGSKQGVIDNVNGIGTEDVIHVARGFIWLGLV